MCWALERSSHGKAAMPAHQSRMAFGGRARQVIDLADQSNVAEEKPRADQMQRLAALAVLPVHLAQIPAAPMRSQHQQQAHRNLDPARNLLPVGGDEQDDAAGDQDRADEGDDRQELAALLLQLEVLNNLPLLLRR